MSHTGAFTGVDSFIMRFPSADDRQVGYETDTITAYTVAENAGRMAYAKLMVNMLRMSPNMVSNMALYNCNSKYLELFSSAVQRSFSNADLSVGGGGVNFKEGKGQRFSNFFSFFWHESSLG